jgi:hypothetical protein
MLSLGVKIVDPKYLDVELSAAPVCGSGARDLAGLGATGKTGDVE